MLRAAFGTAYDASIAKSTRRSWTRSRRVVKRMGECMSITPNTTTGPRHWFRGREAHQFVGHPAHAVGLLAQAIVDTVREPLLVLDKDLRIVTASRSFYRTFAARHEDTDGQLLASLGEGQWDIPHLREQLEKISSENDAFEGYEVEQDFPAIGRRIMLLNARKVFYDDDEYTTILLAIEDVTERRAAEREMRELLVQKDLLLKEMRHRIANSLQIIASILMLKARSVHSAETRRHLQESHQRILSIAAVQNHLEASGRGETIAVAPYLTALCSTLAKSMIGDDHSVQLDVVAGAGIVSSRDAVSLGLIVTEAVINSLKHAFPAGRADGRIIVSYAVAGSDWALSIKDNGVGKQDTDTTTSKPGLGTSIVKALAQQLQADIRIVSDTHGTTVAIMHNASAAHTIADGSGLHRSSLCASRS